MSKNFIHLFSLHTLQLQLSIDQRCSRLHTAANFSAMSLMYSCIPNRNSRIGGIALPCQHQLLMRPQQGAQRTPSQLGHLPWSLMPLEQRVNRALSGLCAHL